MKKVLFIPLDERPCNYDFPYLLAKGTDVDLLRPPIELMGDMKRPGDTEGLWRWLLERAGEADGAILSLDTLLYGGIIPSRLHDMTTEQGAEKLRRLRDLKRKRPELKLFAFHLIMRCPTYSSSEEEPDYYADWGAEIHRIGRLRHLEQLGLISGEERRELQELDRRLPADVLADYLNRRAVNTSLNRLALEYVADGTIDFLIVPQDDSAPYGWTALDQRMIRAAIAELGIELRTYMYPGADEVGCTLLARMVNAFHGRTPAVYPRFSSRKGPFLIPSYEDRMFDESFKYQVTAAGGIVVDSMNDADLAMLVNLPGEKMTEAAYQPAATAGYDVMRNVTELVEFGDAAMRRWGKPLAVADVAYANGGDLQLVRLLREKGLLFRLAGYAGWNTSSNTLGTVIAQSMLYLIYGDTNEHRDFLALRYAEDAGYCSHVRKLVTAGPVAERGYTRERVDGQQGEIAAIVREHLETFVRERIDGAGYRVVIDSCRLPWNRMFEVGLSVRCVAEET